MKKGKKIPMWMHFLGFVFGGWLYIFIIMTIKAFKK